MTITETGPNPQAPIHDERGDRQLAALIETSDYTRRIHWWIRLFGVVWLTTIAIGVLVSITLVSRIGDSNDAEPLIPFTPFTTATTPTYRPATTPTTATEPTYQPAPYQPAAVATAGSYSNRSECMQASETTVAQCAAWFPN